MWPLDLAAQLDRFHGRDARPALRAALEGRTLEVVYQPVVRLEDGALTGFEALVRWAHPRFGLLTPDEGDVSFEGRSVRGLSEKERAEMRLRMGFLFQQSALFDSLTIWENVAFKLLNADHVKRKAAKARAVEALGEGLAPGHRGESAREAQLARRKRRPQPVEEQRAETPGQDAHRQEEPGPA